MGDETAVGPIVSNILVCGEFWSGDEKERSPFCCCVWAGREQEMPWTNLAGRNGGCFLSLPAEREEPHPELVFSADGGHAWSLSFPSYFLIDRSFLPSPTSPG